ncbi:MAG TPA: tRNA epoxyqueuosine(34) reductase QueG [Candidatus Acidoferrales bacterium]|nr:tRNA epoxyqueuosine(34) reductase QueG [Candidatus Acidoferrales bacterium]
MLPPEKTQKLVEHASALGFELCGVTPAADFAESRRFPEWLARGYAGEMKYLHDPRRASPEHVLAGVRSVIVCALNFNAPLPYSTTVAKNSGTKDDLHAQLPRGWISRYAWGDDYHDVLGSKLDELLAWMRGKFGSKFRAKAYVDTGPVLERVAAKYAGLGWLGKNTCLINQRAGSWLFLGVILTDLELAPSLTEDEGLPRDMCGTCRRCIDACPTGAIVEPYVLDARRCIAYLTIELRGPIPEEFRPAMGNMVFGCDICQDVCPWNRKAPATPLAEFLPRQIPMPDGHPGAQETDIKEEPETAHDSESLFKPPLEWLVSLDEEAFRKMFHGSPVKRAKWRGLVRNACVALGNSRLEPGSPEHFRVTEKLRSLAESEDGIIAGHARWALARLGSAAALPASPAD